MIRIFKLIILLVISQVAFGQAPSNYTNINGRYRWIAGMFDSTFHIPKGATPSLRTGGSTNAGAVFYNTSDSSVYTYTGTQWIKLRGTITDTTSLSNRINLKLNISDTASMLSPYLRKVDTTNKFVTQVYKKNGSDSVFYVRGGNHLWAFNDSTGNPGGGGGGKIYYFNGGVSMGTFGGFTMYELGDTANTGAAANFTRATNGNIANFITDPGKPGLLQIPAGVWTIDAYLSETGGGSNNAEIYVQVEKWDGSTITTIATSPIEQITNGSVIDLYTWAVSIPTTSLAVTDRIIIQFYIQNTNGKTVTLYTQNGYVGEVHTTFTTGIGAINGLTAPAQYLVTGTSGTDFNISSVTATHTFNLPTASATNRGALSSADWTAFNNKGSVSSVATNNATGITGGTITTTGTLAIDTTVISTRLWRQKGIDSVQSNLTAGLALKVNISDTSSMLLPYLRKIDTASLSNRINLKVNISDTASMLSPYLRAIDTASLSNRINLKVNISDTSSMLNPYLRKADTTSMLANYVNAAGYGLSKAGQVLSADSATLSNYYLRRNDSLTATNLLGYVTRKILADTAFAIRSSDAGGTVTSVATNNGTGITGGTITTAGTLAIDTLLIATRAWRQKGIDSVEANLTSGLATKLNISDTSSMLTPYLRKVDTASLSNRINLKVNISDTSTMLGNYVNSAGYGITKAGQVVSADSATLSAYYLRRKDSLTSTNLLGYVTRTVLADSAAAIRAAAGGGSISGSGTTNYIPKFTSSTAIGNSQVFDNGTNVGIGTTSPVSALDVSGRISLGGNLYTNVAQTELGAGTLASGYNFNLNNGSPVHQATGGMAGVWYNTGSIQWYTNDSQSANTAATERMRITSGGNVGIGNTNPDSMLTVTNGARFQRGVRMSGLPTAPGTRALRIDANGTLSVADTTTGGISGSGTTNYIPKFTSSTAIGNSTIVDNTSSIVYTYSTNPVLSITDGTRSSFFGTATNNGAYNNNAQIGDAVIRGFNGVDIEGGQGTGNGLRITSTGSAFFGNGDTASSPSLAILSATGGNGTNIAGAEMRIRGGASTGSGAGGPITFYTAAAGATGTTVRSAVERMRIDTKGNVGIGVIPVSTWNVTGKVLEIGHSGGSAAFFQNTVDDYWNVSNAYYDGANWRYTKTGTATALYLGNGFTWFYAGSGTSGNSFSWTRAMDINSSGNLGLGTSTIGSRLQVNGNAAIGYSASTAAPTNGLAVAGNIDITGTSFLKITGNATNPNAADALYLWNEAGFGPNITGLKFAVNTGSTGATSKRFIIESNGNVGINTATIGSRLQVNGNAAIGYSASTAAPTNGLAVSGALAVGTNAELLSAASRGNITINGASTSILTFGVGAVAKAYFFHDNTHLTLANYTATGNIDFNTFSGADGTRMRLTNAGSLGIGTTTIGSTLQVNGNAAIGYSASTAGPTNGLSISGNTTIGTTTAAGKFTIDPDDNQVGLAITGTSLTSANAQSLIDLAQTWNTTGNPTAIKLNITNTASGATADLMELQVGGTSQFTVDKSGNTIMTGSVKTGTPSGGTADTWKLGTKVASSVVLDDNNYLEVEVGGVAYRVALVNLAEPEPEAAPLSSPDGYVRNYGPVATVKLPSTSEKVANLEKEIAELRETIKLLKSKIK